MRSSLIALTVLFATLASPAAHTQGAENGAAGDAPISDVEELTAPVIVDGRTLFRVRGASSHPASVRADAISRRIVASAEDASFDPDTLRLEIRPQAVDVMAAQLRLMSVVDADATLEGVDRETLAAVHEQRIREAILQFRTDRSSAALQVAATRFALATLVFVPAMWLFMRLMRRLQRLLESRYRERVRNVSIQSFKIVQADRIWASVAALMSAIRVLAVAVLGYVYLHYVLGLFPWTRPTAQNLLEYLTEPLGSIGRAVLDAIPNLIFILVIVLAARYGLRLIRLFFDAVGNGGVTLAGFDRDWATPSYRLVRLAAIVLTAVVAYPYIPGSGSEAFKGISIFLGVMFSIGSSSFIANIIAGYALIYRRAFKVGDRVQIDDVIGDVVQTRLQVTHLRSLKNEEVIVPNSLILNSKVVNYSSLAGRGGLILHTTVGIGYDVGWRKVEGLLLLAARRTGGLLSDPEPFVLQKSLGDFAVTYELNVYCSEAQSMARVYTALHASILDVFNEHGVQIMTPAYEGDPPEPKLAPRDQWAVAPAAPTVAA